MPATLRLRSPLQTVLILGSAVATSLGVLGGAVGLFLDDGRTPVFDPGSLLAREAALCERAGTLQARHQCLREVADKAALASRERASRPSAG